MITISVMSFLVADDERFFIRELTVLFEGLYIVDKVQFDNQLDKTV